MFRFVLVVLFVPMDDAMALIVVVHVFVHCLNCRALYSAASQIRGGGGSANEKKNQTEISCEKYLAQLASSIFGIPIARQTDEGATDEDLITM